MSKIKEFFFGRPKRSNLRKARNTMVNSPVKPIQQKKRSSKVVTKQEKS